jgi:hypothetical protein
MPYDKMRFSRQPDGLDFEDDDFDDEFNDDFEEDEEDGLKITVVDPSKLVWNDE